MSIYKEKIKRWREGGEKGWSRRRRRKEREGKGREMIEIDYGSWQVPRSVG